MDALDAFAALTDAEQARLRRLQSGAKFSGAARRKLGEFADEHGWSDEVTNDVLPLLAQRAWTTQFTTHHPCRICGEEAVTVEDEGWACERHRRGTLEGAVNSLDRDG